MVKTIAERKLEAKVVELRAKIFVGDNGYYRVYNLKSKESYWVSIEMHSCTCPAFGNDYYKLDTCKHISFVQDWLEGFDNYCEYEVSFDSPIRAHSFSSMVLANKHRFHSVWVELRGGGYVVHYKSYRSKVTEQVITLSERLRETVGVEKELAPALSRG